LIFKIEFPKTQKKEEGEYILFKKKRGILGDTRKSQKIQEDYGSVSVCNRLAPKIEKNICFTSIRVWLGIPKKFKFFLFKIKFFYVFRSFNLICVGVKIIKKTKKILF
jgi:hypothetical protein